MLRKYAKELLFVLVCLLHSNSVLGAATSDQELYDLGDNLLIILVASRPGEEGGMRWQQNVGSVIGKFKETRLKVTTLTRSVNIKLNGKLERQGQFAVLTFEDDVELSKSKELNDKLSNQGNFYSRLVHWWFLFEEGELYAFAWRKMSLLQMSPATEHLYIFEYLAHQPSRILSLAYKHSPELLQLIPEGSLAHELLLNVHTSLLYSSGLALIASKSALEETGVDVKESPSLLNNQRQKSWEWDFDTPGAPRPPRPILFRIRLTDEGFSLPVRAQAGGG